MSNPTEPSFADLEADNCRLRAEIVELRALYTAVAEKLGTVAGHVGFEPDKSLPVIVDQVQVKMAMALALEQRTLAAAAKWLEDFWRMTKSETGIQIEDKDENSWTKFASDGKGIVDALRRR